MYDRPGRRGCLLEHCKRYPDAARAQRAEGAHALSFGMDRDGRVLGFYLVRSSGCPEFDDEVLALIELAAAMAPSANRSCNSRHVDAVQLLGISVKHRCDVLMWHAYNRMLERIVNGAERRTEAIDWKVACENAPLPANNLDGIANNRNILLEWPNSRRHANSGNFDEDMLQRLDREQSTPPGSNSFRRSVRRKAGVVHDNGRRGLFVCKANNLI